MNNEDGRLDKTITNLIAYAQTNAMKSPVLVFIVNTLAYAKTIIIPSLLKELTAFEIEFSYNKSEMYILIKRPDETYAKLIFITQNESEKKLKGLAIDALFLQEEIKMTYSEFKKLHNYFAMVEAKKKAKEKEDAEKSV